MAEIIPIGLYKKYYQVIDGSNLVITTPLIDLLRIYAVVHYAVEGNDLFIIREHDQLELVQSFENQGAAVQGMIDEYVCDLLMHSKGLTFFLSMEDAVEHIQQQRESENNKDLEIE